MPSRRRFLAGAVTATGASLLRLAPSRAHAAQADGDGSAAWAPEGLVTRAGWEADESLRTWTPKFSPVQVLTVHHSARPAGERPVEEVRAIYDLHARRLGWGDIGYHLLIDPEGALYEGRSAGRGRVPVLGVPPEDDGRDDQEDDQGEDKGDDRRPVCVTGGHVRGHNPGNIGVCLMGDFTRAGPTDDARDTLERTLAALCRACDLDPLGTVRYVNPDTGAARTARVISAHRDWSATSCPGTRVAAVFDRIRRRVAKETR